MYKCSPLISFTVRITALTESQCLYEPHLIRQNNTIRVLAVLALTVFLASTEHAAPDVSFSTRTGAIGTFHTVTFQRHFIWQITMVCLWDETFAFHGKPIVLWVQWKVSQAIELNVGCIECPLNMTFGTITSWGKVSNCHRLSVMVPAET